MKELGENGTAIPSIPDQTYTMKSIEAPGWLENPTTPNSNVAVSITWDPKAKVYERRPAMTN